MKAKIPSCRFGTIPACVQRLSEDLFVHISLVFIIHLFVYIDIDFHPLQSEYRIVGAATNQEITYMSEPTTINRYQRTFENNNQTCWRRPLRAATQSARRIHRTATNHSSKIRGAATNNGKRICQAATNQSSRIHLKRSQSKIKDPLEQQPMEL